MDKPRRLFESGRETIGQPSFLQDCPPSHYLVFQQLRTGGPGFGLHPSETEALLLALARGMDWASEEQQHWYKYDTDLAADWRKLEQEFRAAYNAINLFSGWGDEPDCNMFGQSPEQEGDGA